MFHFPTFPPHALCVQARVTPHDWCGVPPFGHPRINARLTAPRGLSQPPTSFIGSWCPGIHRVPLTTWPHKKPHNRPRKGNDLCGPTQTLLQSQKMLASTVQFSTYNQTPATRPRRTHNPARRGGTRCRPALHEINGCPLPQDPTACLRPPATCDPFPSAPEGTPYWGPADAGGRTGQRSTLELRLEHPRPPETGRPSRSEHGSAPPDQVGRPVLLRKEVIQPHLPVRLPCYDFVPIADPAFDGSLHKGWATGFGRYRLS